MTASMRHAANDSGGSEVSSCETASAAVKPHRGTGVFMPRPAAGSSRVPQRPQAAITATQLQLQQQGMRRSYSGSGSSLPWPCTQQQQPFGGPADNSSSCRSCSFSSSIAVPQSSRAGATPPRHGTGTSSSSNCNSLILTVPENPYLTHHHSAPLAHPVAVQYAAAAAAAALGGALDDDLDDTLCLPGGVLGFSELSDGGLGASPGACSDDLAFGPASLPGGYNTLAGNSHALAGNSFTAAAELNRSLAQLPGSSYSEVSMQGLLGSSVSAAPAHWPHSKAFEQQQQVQPSRALSALAGGGSSSHSFNGRNSSSSSSMQRGQWPASSPLPQPQPLPAAAAAAAVSRQSSRGSGQMLLSQPQQSTSLSNDNQGFWYAQQQLEASSDQMFGSSYQQQQLLLHQQMQQMLTGSIAGGAADADANVYLTECSSPGGTCAPAGLMPSSSLGMTGQPQQQQQQVRLQRRSTITEPPLLWPSALEQQLHSQIGSSSSSSALQPLVRSSSGGSQELQTVHAINAQLEQLLKLKEDVLAAKASVQGLQLPAVSAAAMSPLPPASPLPAAAAAAAAPAYMAAAITNTRCADLLPDLARMSSLPEQLQHLDYQPQQQQQQLYSAPDLQQQQQQQQYVLGSSLGSAGFIMPSSFQLALGNSMQDFAPPAAASTGTDLPLHRCRSSSGGNFGSSRAGQRLVVGSWSGGECCSSGGGLPALELARQKHAVRAATEQKLQQLAALQRMQSDLQEELMHMLQ